LKNTFFKIKNTQKLFKVKKLIKKINKYDLKEKSDEELRDMVNKNIPLEEFLAIISEASFRTLGLRPYNEQLKAVISIAIDGYLVEMRTGEGKTLTAGISALIRAIKGHKVFVVTVNDYLSKRDLEYNTKLFDFFRIKSGVLQSEQNLQERQNIYKSNIVYGTSREFAFDYLRDNTIQDKAQRIYLDIDKYGFDCVIIDEIDSVLIDESSTPLIISEKNKSQNNKLIKTCDLAVKKLSFSEEEKESDFTIDKKARVARLTETGIYKIEKELSIQNLYSLEAVEYLHRIEQALVANFVYECEKDYLIQDNKIVLIDQSTGRLSPGVQLSFGLHQAIEAKEGVEITIENITTAKTTYQNFFNKFKHLSGMTGTAKTEEEEFLDIYGLEIIVIPTHKPVIRKDYQDRIFLNKKGKTSELIRIVKEAHKKGQPILIGTTTVEENEFLSKELKKHNLTFNQLNAKNAEKEAEIISKAGEKGTITLATNMAGRGVDIKLSKESISLGGLYVIGYGRYRNRRIDNQLRGRSGRQGDPGESVFILSLEDETIVNFSGEKLKNIAKNLKVEEDEVIQSKLIEKTIERAQKAYENIYYEARKELVQYDSVLSTQRDKIYSIRNNILDIEDISDFYKKIKELIKDKSSEFNFYDFEDLKLNLLESLYINATEDSYPKTEEDLINYLEYVIFNKFLDLPENISLSIIRSIYIKHIDRNWQHHLSELDALQNGIGLISISKKDPLIEYQKRGFNMFKETLKKITGDILYELFNVSIERENTVSISVIN